MKHSLPLHSQNKGSSALVCEVLASENLIFLQFSYSFYSSDYKKKLRNQIQRLPKSAETMKQVCWGTRLQASKYYFQTVIEPRVNRVYPLVIWEADILRNPLCPAGKPKSECFPVPSLPLACLWLTPCRRPGIAQARRQTCAGVWCYKDMWGWEGRGWGSGKGEELKNLTSYVIRREIVHVEVQHPRAKINLILYGGNKEALEKYKNERNDVW